ncbi:uncharacterized protein LOC123563207 [Mercenaria mercenaria]|uniref:uncharacterized protein LOC123563207 n=1 Tax=Mercenaria mercenaria TaxID=6596 RepID=UPI00234EF1DB|nr:uncharacterized protein LOC123563207 [Mercenaria mercenaria]
MFIRTIIVYIFLSAEYSGLLPRVLPFISGTKVKLVGGNSNLEGRVEVYHNNVWGTICDDGFGNLDAQVLCFMLGYNRTGARAVPEGFYGSGNGTIWLDDLGCNGTELSVDECGKNGEWGSHNCRHSEDAGITCQPKIRLAGGNTSYDGRIEVNYSSTWGTVCDNGFDNADAQVFCQMLGYERLGAEALGNSYFGRGNGQIVLDNLDCSGNETSLNDCNKLVWESKTCTQNTVAGIRCLPKLGVRLSGGLTEYEGLVQIHYSNSWGSICTVDFSEADAQVLCHMLGYPREGAVAYANAYFGQGAGTSWLNNLGCDGQELSIIDCRHTSLVYTNCSRKNDVGIRCNPNVRLVGGSSEYEGRVEVYHSEEWGTVCDDGFDSLDAKVFCYMLGYERNGAEVLPGEYFYPGKGRVWLDELQCTGKEASVDDCNKNENTWGTHNCAHSEDAGVKCQPKSGCPGLVPLENGNYSHSSCTSLTSPTGLNCTILCENGFKPLSFRRTTCLGSGIWNISDAFLTCSDIDECNDKSHQCDQNCRNTLGEHACYCNEGYILDSDNKTCNDVDECGINNGGCSHNCTNEIGSFLCGCIDGYSLQNDSRSCVDLNECDIGNGNCDQICLNTEGSYSCNCTDGYYLMTDGLTCEDVNECAFDNGGCDHVCNNTDGYFFCKCFSGYFLNNDTMSCEDVNECKMNNGGCGHICENANGTFSCSCLPGFVLLNDSAACEDVNECEVNNGGCEHDCVNDNGSFSCDCYRGYAMQTDNSSCVDINECGSNNGGCEHVCINTNGTYGCSCIDGFALQNDTFSCEDINECDIQNGGCAQICTNAVGNYSCLCETGYALQSNRFSCSDINECDTTNGGCEQRCINTLGSFSCGCEDGFLLDSNDYACEDIIECNTDNGGCQQQCINLEGSFSCSCNDRYILKEDGFTCKNVSQRSESSSLRVRIGEQAVIHLMKPATYRYITEQIGKSLQTYFKNFTSLSFSVVIRRIGKFANIHDTNRKDSIVVNYTIVYDAENKLSIRRSLIRGILGFYDWTLLLYDGQFVSAILVNSPPTIFPPDWSVRLSEDTSIGTLVGEFTVYDPDDDIRGDIRVYSDDKPGEIKIGPIVDNKVQLVVEETLDADKYKRSKKHGTLGAIVGHVVNFTVVVKDKPGLQATAHVSLTIIDANDNAPVCRPEEVVVKIPRDTSIGADVYNLKTVCKDDDYVYNNVAFTIEEDSCNAFTVNTPASLALKSNILDQFPSCTITVNVTDLDNPLFHTKLTVKIKFQECPSDVDHLNKAWKRGSPGKYTFGSCPDGYTGEVKRFCNTNAVYQEPVYNCTSAAIAEIFEKVLNENTSMSDVLDDLANVTSPATGNNNSLLIGDLEAVNKVMSKITEVIEVNPVNVKSVTDSFIETANNILDENTTSTWTSMMNETGSGADTVLENLDRFAEKIANVSKTTGEIKVAKTNLFLKVGSTDACDGQEIQFPDRKDGDVPSWAGKTLDKVQIGCGGNLSAQSYSSVMYRNLSQILPSKAVGNSTSEDKKLSAPVMSFSYFPKVEGKLVKPVEITFQLYSGLLEHPSCSFWSKSDSSAGGWSSYGCWLERFDKEKKIVVCKCDHLTNFAVLMSPSSIVSEGHHVALSTISMIGCILSMLCLLLTIAIYGYFWRAVKSEKSIININLSCALFVAYLLFLAGVSQTDNQSACTAMAVLLHLVYLVVFFIMLSEGLLLANTVLYPFSTRKPGMPLLIASYVCPVVIVAISMGAVELDGYGDEKSCWLSTKTGLIWAFLVPVLIIIVINLTIITLVIRAMFSTAALSRKSDKEKAMAGVRSIVILMPIMGLTWVLGIFSVNEDTVVFQYLFALFNSIQGVLIFVFHCVMNKKIQVAFRKQRSKWQSLRSYDLNKSFTTSTKSTRVTEESTSIM